MEIYKEDNNDLWSLNLVFIVIIQNAIELVASWKYFLSFYGFYGSINLSFVTIVKNNKIIGHLTYCPLSTSHGRALKLSYVFECFWQMYLAALLIMIPSIIRKQQIEYSNCVWIPIFQIKSKVLRGAFNMIL